MQRASREDGVHTASFVVYHALAMLQAPLVVISILTSVPRSAVGGPDGLLDELLRMSVEGVRDILLRRKGSNELILHLLDDLNGVFANYAKRAHDGAVLHRPARTDKCNEIGDVRDGDSEVAFGTRLPLRAEFDSVLSYDGKPRLVRDIEASGTHYGVDFALVAFLVNN